MCLVVCKKLECPKNTYLQDHGSSAGLHDNEDDCLVCPDLQFTDPTVNGGKAASECVQCTAGTTFF